MFEKDRGIIAAQRTAQQAYGILCVRRHGHTPAESMQPLDFVRLTVPRVATFEEAAGNAHHHRRSEPIHSTPAHGAAVIQLFGGRIRILAELNFRYRHQSRRGHTDGTADDAFLGEAGVEYSVHTELLLQSQRRRMHAALAADVFAEDQHSGLTFNSCSSVRRTAVTKLMRGP